MKILCFGDSNTYGYDPRGYFGGRYDHPYIVTIELGMMLFVIIVPFAFLPKIGSDGFSMRDCKCFK